ncbi:MAG TPA: lipopolysaccharide biosynthesis protein [Gemmatimonadales bacterium]|nr:lipopolysaccharide biosynthesis protein [Gemmatimonadales bacterium]
MRRWLGQVPPSTLYYLSFLAAPCLGLIQTRLLTFLLSSAEYGVVQLALPILSWTGTIAGLGLPAFLLRFYPRDGAVVFKESVTLTVLVVVPAALLGAWALSATTGGAVRVDPATVVAFTLALTALLAFLLTKAMLRALERHLAYNLMFTLDRVLGLVFITGGVALARSHPVEGYLAGTFLVYGGAMALLVGLGRTKLPVGWQLPPPARVRELLLYGLPTVAVILVADLYANASRYLIVNAGFGTAAVAEFALSYTLTNLAFQSLYEPLLTYMYPQVFKAYEEGRFDEVAQRVNRFLRYYLLAGLVLAGGFMVGGELAVRLVAGQAYWMGASPFLLLVAASYLFGMYRILATHYYMRRNTVELAACFGAGLVVSLGCGAVLLLHHGLIGVSQGVLAGAAFLTLVTWWRGRPILGLNPLRAARARRRGAG